MCIPAIAQLVEHLTVDTCSNQMVPGLIPGGRAFGPAFGPEPTWAQAVVLGVFSYRKFGSGFLYFMIFADSDDFCVFCSFAFWCFFGALAFPCVFLLFVFFDLYRKR